MPRTLTALMLALLGQPAAASEPVDLFSGFAPDWRKDWREQKLASNPTIYSVANEGGLNVLHATSRSANSGLLREFAVERPTAAVLRWRWKVRRVIGAGADERSRAGDDYAARVFVVFETSIIPLRTRAINYVWADLRPAFRATRRPQPAMAERTLAVSLSHRNAAGETGGTLPVPTPLSPGEKRARDLTFL